METENGSKKSKGMIIIIVILGFIVLGLVLYICYDKSVIFQNTEKEDKQSSVKSNKKEKGDATKDKTIVVKELDLSRSLNTNGITYSTPNLASSSNNNIGISMSVGADSKSVTLNIDWNKFGEFSGASAWVPTVESYSITGFHKKIKDAFIGELGQDAMGLTLFYLMSDGTVEYTPMFNQQGQMNYTASDGTTKEHFETKGMVNGVSEIIKLYNVDASNGSGWGTTIGAKADGSFYDLGDIISK